MKPNEKCLSELDLLFDKKEVQSIKKELEKGYPVIKQTNVYADCKYIKLIDTVSSKNNQIADLTKKSYNEIIEEKSINFAIDAKGRVLDGDNETIYEYVNPNASKGVCVSVDMKIQKILAQLSSKLAQLSLWITMNPVNFLWITLRIVDNLVLGDFIFFI